MKVKSKILIAVIPIMIVFIVMLNIVFGLFFQDYVKQDEENQLKIAANGLIRYVWEIGDGYQGSANDWGHWDDTFEFVETRNREYIQSNLMADTFENLDVNFIIITDRDRQAIYERYYSMAANDFAQLPSGFSTEELISYSDLQEDVSSIKKIGSRFFFVASTDITDSAKTKPAIGKLIIGREIDQSVIGNLEAITGLRVHSISNLADGNLLKDLIEPTIYNRSFSPAQDNIYINLAIPNQYRIQEAIRIDLEMPRNLYISSMDRVFRFSLLNTVGCIIIMLAIIAIMGNLISKPFEALMQDVLSVSSKDHKYSRIPEKGSREFSSLRKSINELLGKIESSQLELNDSKRKLQATLTSVGDGVIATDANQFIAFMNPVAEHLTGWTYEEASGIPISHVFKIINEYSREDVEIPVKAVFETGKAIELTNHTLLIAKDGTERPIEDTAAPIIDESGLITGCVLVFKDFSEQKEKQRRIEYLSYHDQLTGLYNRRFFEEELRRLDVERNLPVSIVYADVNGLKIVNDAFGHDSGDELIRFVAQSFKDACRSDDIIARVGGDEFILLLPKTDFQAAREVVDRIKERLASEQVKEMSVSVSFGCDTKVEKSRDILDVTKCAENLMYQKKVFNNNTKRNGIIKSILNALQLKCPREEAHSKRVSLLCERIGRAYELSEDDIRELSVAGELHDIGKIAIDKAILNKDAQLSPMEWFHIKQHPETGYRILNATSEFSFISEYVLEHHERFDGNGYPKGLKGDAINWKARVIAIADAYDAMTCSRPYKESLSDVEAIEELQKHAGTQFDPEIASVFIDKVLLSEGMEVRVGSQV